MDMDLTMILTMKVNRYYQRRNPRLQNYNTAMQIIQIQMQYPAHRYRHRHRHRHHLPFLQEMKLSNLL
jgi:hypothetical protein